MTDTDIRQAILDEEHIEQLSIGYVVSGAVNAFFSCFGLVYAVVGLSLSSAFSSQNKDFSAPAIGMAFGLISLGFFLSSVGLALLKSRAAFCLRRYRSRVFVLVAGGISCFGLPYGTILGIATFLVLYRPSVIQSVRSGEDRLKLRFGREASLSRSWPRRKTTSRAHGPQSSGNGRLLQSFDFSDIFRFPEHDQNVAGFDHEIGRRRQQQGAGAAVFDGNDVHVVLGP